MSPICSTHHKIGFKHTICLTRGIVCPREESVLRTSDQGEQMLQENASTYKRVARESTRQLNREESILGTHPWTYLFHRLLLICLTHLEEWHPSHSILKDKGSYASCVTICSIVTVTWKSTILSNSTYLSTGICYQSVQLTLGYVTVLGQAPQQNRSIQDSNPINGTEQKLRV